MADYDRSPSPRRDDEPDHRGSAAPAAGGAPRAGPTSALYVGSLSWSANEDDLKQIFGRFGQVKNVSIPRRHDGLSKGFAFVEFETVSDAETAMREMQNQDVKGRAVRLDFDAGPGSRPAPRRGDRGGFGGERRGGFRGGFRGGREGGRYEPYNRERRGGYGGDRGGYDRPQGGEGYDRRY